MIAASRNVFGLRASVARAGGVGRMCTPKPVLSTSSRAFWGGAFETEFEENRAKARRRRLRGFLSSMELLPAGAMAAPQEITRSIFAEHAPGGSFRSQEHLRQAVDGVRMRLLDLQTAGPFILQLEASDGGSSSVGTAAPDSPSPPNDHASPNALTTPPPLPPSELPELPPDVLTELQQHTLASMRMAAAIDGLPSLWTALAQPAPSAGAAEPASQNGALTVPLPLAVDAAFALSDPDPWERVRFRVSLAQSQVGCRVAVEAKVAAPTADEVRAAARSTVHAAEPLLRTLLAQTEMLDQPERQRLAALQLAAPTSEPPPPVGGGLRARFRRLRWLRNLQRNLQPSAAEVLWEELCRKSRLERLGWLILGRRWDREAKAAMAAAGGAPLAVVAAGDGRYGALYAALRSDSTMHLALTGALFAYNDRQSTRRRRMMNALKATALFVGLNFVDFAICNL